MNLERGTAQPELRVLSQTDEQFEGKYRLSRHLLPENCKFYTNQKWAKIAIGYTAMDSSYKNRYLMFILRKEVKRNKRFFRPFSRGNTFGRYWFSENRGLKRGELKLT